LTLTLAVEVPVAFALGLRTRLAVLAVVCVNLITNPALNLLSYASAQLWHWQSSVVTAIPIVFLVEVVVIVVEWRLLLWALGGDRRRLLRISLAMNAASALTGVIVFWL
jgi:hypothetical protein